MCQSWGHCGAPARLGCLVTFAVLAFAAKAADSAAQARGILEQMSRATKALNYEGTFVWLRGSEAATMRIVHKVDDKGEHERLVTLTGTSKEIVRHGNEVTCTIPGDRRVVVQKKPPRDPLGPAWHQPIAKIAEFYDFSVLGGDRVAGRPAWVVAILSSDPDRYSYRLWIDSSTYLLLKSQVIGIEDSVLEQVLFTALETPVQIPDSALEPTVSGQGYTFYLNDGPSAPEIDDGWMVSWLPRGFAMDEHKMHEMPENRRLVNHQVYSDGLASVSVYIEKSAGPMLSGSGHSSMGAINTYSTMRAGHQITVVGEVPASTVRQIAGSVSPRGTVP